MPDEQQRARADLERRRRALVERLAATRRPAPRLSPEEETRRHAIRYARDRGISLEAAYQAFERTRRDEARYGRNNVPAIVAARKARGERMPVDPDTVAAQVRGELGNQRRRQGPRPARSLESPEALRRRTAELAGGDRAAAAAAYDGLRDLRDEMRPPETAAQRLSRLRADDDGWGTTAKKFFQNLDDRILGQGGGGLIAAIPGTVRQAVKATNPVAGLLMPDDDPISRSLEGFGRGVHDRATREIARNRPDLDGSPEKRMAYDILNGFVDLGVAVGVTAATRNPQAGAAMLATQAFGTRFGESLNKGRGRDAAFADAAIHGLAAMVGPKVRIGSVVAPGRSLGARAVSRSADGAVQGAVTSTIQTLYEKGAIDPDMTMGEVLDTIVHDTLVSAATAPFDGPSHDYVAERGRRRDAIREIRDMDLDNGGAAVRAQDPNPRPPVAEDRYGNPMRWNGRSWVPAR